MEQEISYPMDECYFCNSRLYQGSCYTNNCTDSHSYMVRKGYSNDAGEISFIIGDYGFYFDFSGDMEVCLLDHKGKIKELIPFPHWLQVTKDNYLSVVERVRKLQTFS